MEANKVGHLKLRGWYGMVSMVFYWSKIAHMTIFFQEPLRKQWLHKAIYTKSDMLKQVWLFTHLISNQTTWPQFWPSWKGVTVLEQFVPISVMALVSNGNAKAVSSRCLCPPCGSLPTPDSSISKVWRSYADIWWLLTAMTCLPLGSLLAWDIRYSFTQ